MVVGGMEGTNPGDKQASVLILTIQVRPGVSDFISPSLSFLSCEMGRTTAYVS